MISIGRPLLGDEEKRAVMDVLDSGWLVQGPRVKAFEDAFAKYISVKHAVAITNGTLALHSAFMALHLGPGDEVVTTPFSFVASSNAIRMCGAKPVFADIYPETYNLDPSCMEEKITDKTKAVMPVHLYGNPADMGSIMKIAKAHGIGVAEDAAQAHGAELNGRRCGSFGNVAAFSFYPSKNMTTGEGGMVTTSDDATAATLRLIRDHAQQEKYKHVFLGYNYRMTEMCAAIGIEQLKKLDGFNRRRIENARFLTEQLDGVNDLTTPQTYKGAKHVYHLYTIRVLGGKRDHVQKSLAESGVDARVFYPLPIHKQPFYEKESHGSFPEAEKASREALSLPVHPALSQDDLETIVHAVKKAIA